MEFDEAALQEVRETRLYIDKLDAWLLDRIKPFIGQRVLEVGCGYGNFIQHLVDREMIVGIDTSESSVEYVNTIFGDSPNVFSFVHDVTSPDFLELKKYQFDTVISLNVMEHIENDILALQQIHEVLAPGGTLILIVPAHPILYGTMDSSIGHFRRYTFQDLNNKLESVGFKAYHQQYLNPLGALGWFINGRVLRRKVPPVAQLKMFNRFMPLVVGIENTVKSPFGISLESISKRI